MNHVQTIQLFTNVITQPTASVPRLQACLQARQRGQANDPLFFPFIYTPTALRFITLFSEKELSDSTHNRLKL